MEINWQLIGYAAHMLWRNLVSKYGFVNVALWTAGIYVVGMIAVTLWEKCEERSLQKWRESPDYQEYKSRSTLPSNTFNSGDYIQGNGFYMKKSPSYTFNPADYIKGDGFYMKR